MNGEPRRRGRSLNCRAPPGQTALPSRPAHLPAVIDSGSPRYCPISRAAFDNHEVVCWSSIPWVTSISVTLR